MSVTLADPEMPGDMCVVFPDHLEEIVTGFLGHIVGRTGLACDPAKLSAVRNWHALDKVKVVCQSVGFVGYCRTGETVGAPDAEGCLLCLDRPTADGLRCSEGLFDKCTHI